LYGLTNSNYYDHKTATNSVQIERNRGIETMNNPSLRNLQRSSSAFEEEELLDINDMKMARSPSPMMATLNIPDYAFNDSLNYDSAVSNIAANTDHEGDRYELDDDEHHQNIIYPQHQTLKIIVSAPEREEEDDEYLNEEKRRYIPSDSDIESVASSAFSSSEDEESDINEMSLKQRSSLFLSGNDLNVGVYSCFPFSDHSETDYLSPQSGDFDELTICYKYHQDRNERNIRFREHYLSDLGPSDIGSSDTENFSSPDSLPDSIPPSIEFVPII